MLFQDYHSSPGRLIGSLILFAIITRVTIPPFIGHPPNFSSIDAIALFCGACFSNRLMAFTVVFFSVWIGDIVLNKMLMGYWVLFYAGCFWQYAAHLLVVLIGISLKHNLGVVRLFSACLAASLLFFSLSNAGVWFSGGLYPFTMEGLIACYVAAIPFFKNTVLSNLFFSMVLFGAYKFSFPTGKLVTHTEKS